MQHAAAGGNTFKRLTPRLVLTRIVRTLRQLKHLPVTAAKLALDLSTAGRHTLRLQADALNHLTRIQEALGLQKDRPALAAADLALPRCSPQAGRP